MNTSYIEFYHFFSKEAFCKLQKYFFAYDETSFTQKLEEPLDNPKIVYKSVDPFSGEENYEELRFEEDFVYKEITKLADKQFLKFKAEINNKGIYETKTLSDFAKAYISKKREYSTEIGLAEYLPVKLIASLQLQLEKLEEYIEQYIENPDPNFKQKISFNWSSSEVLLFFHLLRKNKIIDWIEDRDLGRILEYSCNYLTDKEYSPIRNARKILGGFRRGERIPDKPLEKIKDDLSNENFFSLED
ncbi:hypothetical protein [Mesonia mobilis]|uniref:RteC protein n=1 Tax=Mesonia mobilis TaxID=369791 RepID=A0ABQ3BTR8_9FLAO|nr:hypothetical protein [Mesonia mobilis]MBQ0739104.1 hypothetical protein [Aquimarina celericrescens]GGZ56457.1 hypothetical protein GCM10008088_17540 [Mesonia mobilis]